MKSVQPIKKNLATQGPSTESILVAYQDAAQTADLAKQKALHVGQLLNEKRAALSPFSHDGKTGKFQSKSDDDSFVVWLKTEASAIPQSTAYRWMDYASRVAHGALGGCGGDNGIRLLDNGTIDIEGEIITVSEILSRPTEDLPEAATTARQLLLDFLGDHTMSETLKGVVVEGNDPSAITRAHNGKSKGGSNGEDRKDYPVFVGKALRVLSKHVDSEAHAVSPAQQAKIVSAFDAATAAWPRWLLVPLQEALKREVKLTDPERAARKNG